MEKKDTEQETLEKDTEAQSEETAELDLPKFFERFKEVERKIDDISSRMEGRVSQFGREIAKFRSLVKSTDTTEPKTESKTEPKTSSLSEEDLFAALRYKELHSKLGTKQREALQELKSGRSFSETISIAEKLFEEGEMPTKAKPKYGATPASTGFSHPTTVAEYYKLTQGQKEALRKDPTFDPSKLRRK